VRRHFSPENSFKIETEKSRLKEHLSTILFPLKI
jgi:hypothetical protein